LAPGQTLGIVGESGSGKTVSSLTALGLTRARGSDISGKIIFEDQDLVTMSDDDLRAIRGNDVAMIFQDPLSSLHPFYKGHGTGTTACHYPLTDQEIQSQLPAALTRADRPGQTAAPVTP
ncbi:MAG: ATP-binding cassette domain-containing protein, partial [Actinomycetota bacterium]|nr:ATP-binding cassette domain-containing protein [Actinomycetota bacterium]